MDLAHTKGVVTGRIYAASLLRPAHTMRKPRCPYPFWRFVSCFAWRLGFAMGVFEVLYRD